MLVGTEGLQILSDDLVKKRRQSGASWSKGATVTGASSFPRKCAGALLHRYWRGVLTNPARTGLSSTYRAAVSKYGSSRTNEANLPCQRCPRQT